MRDDVIPRLNRGHALAHLLDYATALMAEDHRNNPSGSLPERVRTSVWHRLVVTMRIRTSPSFGPSRSTSSISSAVWLSGDGGAGFHEEFLR